jgi:hypothetical protein
MVSAHPPRVCGGDLPLRAKSSRANRPAQRRTGIDTFQPPAGGTPRNAATEGTPMPPLAWAVLPISCYWPKAINLPDTPAAGVWPTAFLPVSSNACRHAQMCRTTRAPPTIALLHRSAACGRNQKCWLKKQDVAPLRCSGRRAAGNVVLRTPLSDGRTSSRSTAGRRRRPHFAATSRGLDTSRWCGRCPARRSRTAASPVRS